ncbi:MAG: mechanosensitive ion channel [Prevotella sp.]|nr:mechanosensitive ion channel [Prevotella sp.]
MIRTGMLLLVSMMVLTAVAQDDATAQHDSLIARLEQALQEAKLHNIVLQEQLDKSGESQRQDSLRQAERQHRIDSLRQFTTGSPVVVDGDTLFVLYAKSGGSTPEMRAAAAQDVIRSLGRSLKMTPDSIYIAEADHSTDIMGGDQVVLTVVDLDGMWNNTTRERLAADYAHIIEQKVGQMHREYGLEKKLMGLFWMLLLIVGQWFLFKLTVRLFAWLRRQIASVWMNKMKPLKIKDYEFLNIHQQGRILIFLTRVGQLLTILLQLAISIPLLFSVFPETKAVTYRLIGYVWDPLWHIVLGIVHYIPNLIQIVIVFYAFRYLVRFLRYMAGEIENGKLKINGFYPEWAMPTFFIVRVFAYAFMLVMIWPLLPYSDSGVFKGISVFLGVIVSFSSSSVIGNMVSGIVMTYMRPFRIGDFIRFEDNEGEVIEKTVLVTRIRTLKNDIITIPNSSILQAKTFNYTLSAENYGIIVHTQFTMGYDINWRTCERLLTEAALATPYIEHHPKPFVLAHALDDSYLTYEINAYTHHSQDLLTVYSDLHKNVVDKFNEAGIEVMAPHIYARRDGIRRQAPDYDDKR